LPVHFGKTATSRRAGRTSASEPAAMIDEQIVVG
jgi:hypothetical protein